MFRYLNVFPKQHHFLSGELVLPVVLALPYVLLKELKRCCRESLLRGENPVLRSPGNVARACLCLGRAHFPVVCVATWRGWG